MLERLVSFAGSASGQAYDLCLLLTAVSSSNTFSQHRTDLRSVLLPSQPLARLCIQWQRWGFCWLEGGGVWPRLGCLPVARGCWESVPGGGAEELRGLATAQSILWGHGASSQVWLCITVESS